jgi:hypothetical protein
MPSLTPTYSVSINTGIVDKPEGRALRGSGRGWEPVELSEHELADSIRRGRPLAPQYRGGHRKTANFTCAGFLAADVDRDITLEEAKDHALVRRHAGLIHTTASHTPAHHRFRIIFLLDEPILTAPEWADAQLGLALTLASDRSVSDGARMFFGNSRAIIFRISRTMPAHVVANLIARGQDARASYSAAVKDRMPVDSARRMGGAELVKLATGDLWRMDELQVGASVHCPYHEDTHASAFAVRSTRGSIGIHCSACKVTFWPDNQRDSYDFDAFDRLFEARRIGEQQPREDAIGFDQFFPLEPKFIRFQEPFLPAIRYAPGLTMVKSRKGSGKTEALVSMIRAIRAGEFPDSIRPRDRPKSILLIGHRRTLIREAAAKLHLRCYIEPDDDDYGTLQTLAVCLDSLPKYGESFDANPKTGQSTWRRKGPFDLVIIDEVEQVLKHLLSETIDQRAGLERCFDALMYEVTHAKAVIALDADLGLLTAHAMRTMRPRDWESGCRIIFNAPVVSAEKRTMRLFSDRKLLEHEVIAAICRGERCFITSNSKEFILNAERMILNGCGEHVVMRVVTGDNSRDESVVNFVKNIKTEFLKVQVVLTTPSMGTGIDITFPNGECKVDRVFGFFLPMVNTHTDIDQQLCRVRNPGAVDVWISETTFNFTCNVEVVKDDLARAYTVRRAVRGKRSDGMVDYDRDDPLLMICAHVTALERASKNRLVELFCKLREANGWDIHRVRKFVVGSPYNEARHLRREERAEMLLKARALTDSDFIDLDMRVCSGEALSPKEMAAHEKYRFERAVGVPLDADLVKMNLDGRLIERIQTLAEITSLWSKGYPTDLFDALAEPTRLPRGRLQTMSPARLIGVLMWVADLTMPTGFRADHSVSVPGLSEFVRVCRENQTVIEEILSEVTRSDLEVNPVGQLNRYLKRIGLRLKQTHSEKKQDDGKVRYYSLEAGLVDRMTFLAASYSEVQRQREVEEEADRRPVSRRLSGDRTPEQGTEENSPYLDTSMGLLSLIDDKA